MNFKNLSLLAAAALAASVLSLHLVAYTYHFYWTLWWFDILMHGLGGVAIGTLVLWVWIFWFRIFISRRVSRVVVIILGTLCIGIMWEMFEYIIGSPLHQPFDSYVLDTVLDIAMDLAGGLLAYIGFSRYA